MLCSRRLMRKDMILGDECPAEDLFGNSDHLLCERDEPRVGRLLFLFQLHENLKNKR